MRFRAEASVGNGEGVFDAAYDLGAEAGEEATATGSAREIGDAVALYLATLTPEAVVAMRYGTKSFFVQVVITPEDEGSGSRRS